MALVQATSLIGRAGHGGDHHGHLPAGVDLALDAQGDVLDTVDVGDGSAAELLDDSRHRTVAIGL
jgi:hypothetical protein